MSIANDFLATWDKSDSEIRSVLDLAQKIRDRFYEGKSTNGVDQGRKRAIHALFAGGYFRSQLQARGGIGGSV